jgi:hypothetical protein
MTNGEPCGIRIAIDVSARVPDVETILVAVLKDLSSSVVEHSQTVLEIPAPVL